MKSQPSPPSAWRWITCRKSDLPSPAAKRAALAQQETEAARQTSGDSALRQTTAADAATARSQGFFCNSFCSRRMHLHKQGTNTMNLLQKPKMELSWLMRTGCNRSF